MLSQLIEALSLPVHRSDEYVVSLYQERLVTLVAASGLAFYAWLFVAWTVSLMHHPEPAGADARAPALALVAACAAMALRRRPHLASLAFVAGLGGSLYLWPDPPRFLLAPALVCAAGLLLSRQASALAALALSFLPGLPSASLAAIWATTASFWLASGYIHAALSQAAERQRQAYDLERELLKRRGELRRLNDSLRNAYTLLERTNHELAEARDEAEEARRLKVQFAANISHELRTPLNLILGFAEVMHTTPESYSGAVFTAELRGDIREVYENSRHLLALVDDVLDLSHIEQVRLALAPEESDIGELVRQAADTAAGLFRSKPVQLLLDLEEPLPFCTVDRTRIRQVLINLLTNAARFTDRGEVTVRAAYDEPKQEIVVSVADTGVGIPAEERTRIFDAFHQVDSPARKAGTGGTGLGLAICKTFIELHGGRIWVESEVGKGSCFSFTIPVRHYAAAPSCAWKYSAAPDPFGDSVVLLAGDARAAHRLERSLGQIRVHSARQPAEVRSLVEQWHPKAVLMVSRNGGPETEIDRVRDVAACVGLPVLACRLRQARALSDFANVRSVLSKPVTARALLEALDSIGPLRTVLLAEDDEGMSRLLQRTISLARPGLEILTAYDGEQALAQLCSRRPDALVLDLAMPQIGGLEVLEEMAQSDLCRVPVIVLTALDLGELGGELAAERLVITSCGGLGEADVHRFVKAVVEAATPRYTTPLELDGEGQEERHDLLVPGGGELQYR